MFNTFVRSAPLQFHIFTQKFISRGSQGSFYPAIKICRISKINKNHSRPPRSCTLSRFQVVRDHRTKKGYFDKYFSDRRDCNCGSVLSLDVSMRDFVVILQQTFTNVSAILRRLITFPLNAKNPITEQSRVQGIEQFLSSITSRAESCQRVSLLRICLCIDVMTNATRRQENNTESEQRQPQMLPTCVWREQEARNEGEKWGNWKLFSLQRI